MKTTDWLLKFSWIFVCSGFSAAMDVPAQDAPPLPPAPPLPKRSFPAFRPVPLRTGPPTNAPITATTIPGAPVPVLQPQAAQINPAVAAVNPAVPVATQVTNPGALVFDSEQKEYSAKPGEAVANFTF